MKDIEPTHNRAANALTTAWRQTLAFLARSKAATRILIICSPESLGFSVHPRACHSIDCFSRVDQFSVPELARIYFPQ